MTGTPVIELRTLGRLDLRRGDGSELGEALQQPRRAALLIYLALATPRGFHAKDTILALFWPDRDADHARHALSQAIYYLRHALGDGVLISRRNELGLAPDAFWCDAAALEHALDADQPQEALALYEGELLSGFFITDAPGFEQWVDGQRLRLRDLAAQAAWRLAESAQQEGDGPQTLTWGRRALELSPHDEGALRQLVGLLERVGDRAAAMQAYEAFAWTLKQELELEPSQETQELIQALRDRNATVGHGIADRVVEPEHAAPPSGAADVRHATEPSVGARRIVRWAVPLLALAVVVAWVILGRAPSAPPGALDPDVVAVFPFRLAGSDADAEYLADGIVELLAVRLTGTGGPRAADPTVSRSAWERATQTLGGPLPQSAAVELAGDLGAGQLVVGGVVVTSDRLLVNATLLDTRTGMERARAAAEGPRDSLTTVVDRLTAELLSLGAGEDQLRLSILTTGSQDALRFYLEGKAAYKSGRFEEATRHFDHAIQIDSTFALAGLYIIDAASWVGVEAEVRERAVNAAWKHRDRLSERDLALLLSYVGRRYPEVPAPDLIEDLEHRDRLIELAPDRPQSWYVYGDLFFHHGIRLGFTDGLEQAASAFRKASELDPSFAAPLHHLIELAAHSGDTAGVRRYGEQFLHANTNAEFADYLRWRSAVALGDDAALSELRQRVEAFNVASLDQIIQVSQYDGVGLEDTERAARIMPRASRSPREQRQTLVLLRATALNRGRPEEATELGEALRERSEPWEIFYRHPVYDALYWDGDRTVARRSVESLERYTDQAWSDDAGERFLQRHAVCILAQWQLAQRDTTGPSAAIAKLRSFVTPAYSLRWTLRNHFCATLLEAVLESYRPNAETEHPMLDSLDAWRRRGPHAPPEDRITNLIIARLRHQYGEYESALAAARGWVRGGAPYYLSSYLLAEARAAAALGNREAAVKAYSHYLALRADPEPSLLPLVQSVRDELAEVVSR